MTVAVRTYCRAECTNVLPACVMLHWMGSSILLLIGLLLLLYAMDCIGLFFCFFFSSVLPCLCTGM